MPQFTRSAAALLVIIVAIIAGAVIFFSCSSGSDDDGPQVLTITSPTAKATAAKSTLPPTPLPTPLPTDTPTFEPSPIPPVQTPEGPGPTPVEAPQIQLQPGPQMGQGQWTTIRLWNYSASSAMAVFLDRRYPLVAQGEFFWGVLTSAANQAPGDYQVTVELYEENGSLLGELATWITVYDAGYAVEYIDLPPESSALLTPELAQQEENIRAGVFAMFTPARLWVGPFLYPIASGIVSYYGTGRSYNGGPVSGYHHGVDLAGNEGDPIAASNSGRVAYAGPSPIRGNSVIIDHGVGVFSGYHHLSAMNVQVGQMVNKGDLIGLVGSTGMVTGPHLHWEIVIRGQEVDPLLWTEQDIGY